MAVPAHGRTPTLSRRELAAALRRHRRLAEISAERVLRELGFSASKLSRIETGRRPVSIQDVEALCALYGVVADERERLVHLAKESRQAGPLQRFLVPFAEYAELEAAATTLDDYKTTIITSLLQIPDYSRALIRGIEPYLPDDLVEQRIEGLAIRQNTFARQDPPKATFVMDEAALHRVTGGPQTMANQLAHLAQMARRENVSVLVIPFTRGAHPGMDSLFTILSFHEEVRDVVYVDSVKGDEYLSASADIERYRTYMDRLCDAALGEEASLELIRQRQADFS